MAARMLPFRKSPENCVGRVWTVRCCGWERNRCRIVSPAFGVRKLTSFLDRFFFSVDKKKIAGKLAASVVLCRRGGASASFERLNQYFLMTNMHVVSSQYWNQVHGYTAEDAKRDLEGMQTMRTLAQNMSYLLKAQTAVNDAGIGKPEYEKTVYTNFMD